MKIAKIAVVVTCLLTMPSMLQAQTPARSDWARVEALPPDATILVGVRGAPRWKCSLVAVDDQTLTCHSQRFASGWPFGVIPFDRTLARDQISWIALRGRSVVPYVAGAAALIGFAAGASEDASSAGQRVALGVLVGGALSLFGYIVGNVIELSRELMPARHIYEKP